MDRSQYLVQAMEQMGQTAQPQGPTGPDLAAMKQAAGPRRVSPGQAIMGAPQSALANLQSLLGMGAKRGGSAPP